MEELKQQLDTAPRFGLNAKELLLRAVAAKDDDDFIFDDVDRKPSHSKPDKHIDWSKGPMLFNALPVAEKPIVPFIARGSKVPRVTRQAHLDRLTGHYLLLLLQGKGNLQRVKADIELRRQAVEAAVLHEEELYKQSGSKGVYCNLAARQPATVDRLHTHAAAVHAGADNEQLDGHKDKRARTCAPQAHAEPVQNAELLGNMALPDSAGHANRQPAAAGAKVAAQPTVHQRADAAQVPGVHVQPVATPATQQCTDEQQHPNMVLPSSSGQPTAAGSARDAQTVGGAEHNTEQHAGQPPVPAAIGMRIQQGHPLADAHDLPQPYSPPPPDVQRPQSPPYSPAAQDTEPCAPQPYSPPPPDSQQTQPPTHSTLAQNTEVRAQEPYSPPIPTHLEPADVPPQPASAASRQGCNPMEAAVPQQTAVSAEHPLDSELVKATVAAADATGFLEQPCTAAEGSGLCRGTTPDKALLASVSSAALAPVREEQRCPTGQLFKPTAVAVSHAGDAVIVSTAGHPAQQHDGTKGELQAAIASEKAVPEATSCREHVGPDPQDGTAVHVGTLAEQDDVAQDREWENVAACIASSHSTVAPGPAGKAQDQGSTEHKAYPQAAQSEGHPVVPPQLPSSASRGQSSAMADGSTAGKEAAAAGLPATPRAASARIRANKHVHHAVTSFVKACVNPLYREGSISKQEFKQVVAKSVEKVLAAHEGAEDAGFLVVEGNSIRSLVKQYIAYFKAQTILSAGT